MGEKRETAELKEDARTLTSIAVLIKPARITLRQLRFLLETASSILVAMGGSSFFVSLGYYAFHVEGGPKPYVYLAGIILSSLAGISIIFLLARKIYQQRKLETNEAAKGVRLRESELFKTLERDFERIIKRREVHGG